MRTTQKQRIQTTDNLHPQRTAQSLKSYETELAQESTHLKPHQHENQDMPDGALNAIPTSSEHRHEWRLFQGTLEGGGDVQPV